MATYSIRTDDYDEKNLEYLIKEHGGYGNKRSTILRAALEAFKFMEAEDRENFIMKIRSRDKRRCTRYGF